MRGAPGTEAPRNRFRGGSEEEERLELPTESPVCSPVALALPLIAGLLLPVAAFAHGKARPTHRGHGKGKVVNTMTRNLYLGADLTPAIAAPNATESSSPPTARSCAK